MSSCFCHFPTQFVHGYSYLQLGRLHRQMLQVLGGAGWYTGIYRSCCKTIPFLQPTQFELGYFEFRVIPQNNLPRICLSRDISNGNIFPFPEGSKWQDSKYCLCFFLNTLLSLFSMGSPAIRKFKLARTHSNKDSQYNVLF